MPPFIMQPKNRNYEDLSIDEQDSWLRSCSDGQIFDITIYAPLDSQIVEDAQIEYWRRRGSTRVTDLQWRINRIRKKAGLAASCP